MKRPKSKAGDAPVKPMSPKETLLAERNELLVRDRDSYAESYRKAAEKVQRAEDQLSWNKSAAKAVDDAKAVIVKSLDEVRAAVDHLSDRVSSIEKRFPALMDRLNLVLMKLEEQKPRARKAGRR